MRNRNSSQHAADTSEAEEVILDTAQQRAFVEELAATAVRHARTWRCAFGSLSGAVGLAFTWFAARQVTRTFPITDLPTKVKYALSFLAQCARLFRHLLQQAWCYTISLAGKLAFASNFKHDTRASTP